MKSVQKFTPLHRTLHWVMVLAMSILFLTGFLRMTWMDKHKVADIIASKTEMLSQDQMISIAKAIREPMWEWHEIFAFVMITAIVIRLIYMMTKGIRFPNPFDSNNSLKDRFKGFSYIYFYFLVVMSAFTGICLKFSFFDDFHENIENTHKLGLYLYPIFFIIHIAGVVIGEHRGNKGIVSKMISGD